MSMDKNLSNSHVLTVTAYGEGSNSDFRVTINPMNVKMLIAQDATLRDMPLKKVTVVFLEGDSAELVVSILDLSSMEQAVGSYGFEFF